MKAASIFSLRKLSCRTAAVGFCVLGVACTSLPELPSDPRDRCEALGGAPMTSPPAILADGTSSPGEFQYCRRDTHSSEEDIRRARRAWHERNKAPTRPAASPSR